MTLLNDIFYGLSFLTLLFGAWFIFDLPIYVVIVLAVAAAYSLHHRLRHGVYEVSESILFAPIDNPVAASLASQITNTMTLQQIEDFVTDRPSHQGIHARTQRIER